MFLKAVSLISIVTPVFNAEQYLQDSISSVISQSFQNWELVIVDDGSRDSSGEIVQSFRDSRIKYLKQQKKGVSAARNLGQEKMQGDYFCFLDADDQLPAGSLEARLKIFKEHPELSFVDGQIKKCSLDLSREEGSWTPNLWENPLSDLLTLSGKSFFGPSWMIKRKPGKQYRFKEGLTHGEDLLFFIELARDGGLYGYTEEAVLNYRTGHQSAMKNLKGLEQGYRNLYQEINKMDDVPKYLKEAFRKKSKSIMVKSYLGKGKVMDGMMVWMDKGW
jgi:teichuronic acid biosynthesis glycosyltransferase TuaG